MSEIQSVIFKKQNYTPTLARNWLKKHNIKPLKRVDITTHTLRYRVSDPKKYKQFVTKRITKDISLVLGF